MTDSVYNTWYTQANRCTVGSTLEGGQWPRGTEVDLGDFQRRLSSLPRGCGPISREPAHNADHEGPGSPGTTCATCFDHDLVPIGSRLPREIFRMNGEAEYSRNFAT